MNKLISISLILIFSWIVGVSSIQANETLKRMKDRIPEVVSMKNEGRIGEKRNGLLGVVNEGDQEAKALVEAQNQDRLRVYKKRAESQDQDLETFQRVLGDARIRKEKSGRYVQSLTGVWEKKP